MKGDFRPPLLASVLALVLLGCDIAVLWGIGYVFDDWLTLLLSRRIPSPLALFSRDNMLGAFYRPIGLLWWWLLAHLGDPGPALRHLAALALHTLGAGLAGLTVWHWRRNRGSALAAGFLWLSSPVAISCVSWLAGVYDLLAVVFSAATLIFALRYCVGLRTRDLALSSFALLLAIGSKESAYLLPGLVFLLARKAPSEKRALWVLATWHLSTLILAALARRLVLGRWIGGYTSNALGFSAERFSELGEALSLHAPGLAWYAALAGVCLVLVCAGRDRRKEALPLAMPALALALVPLLFALINPSVPLLMPQRYAAYGAFVLCFPMSLLVEDKGRGRLVGWAMIALLLVCGQVSGLAAARRVASHSVVERQQIRLVLGHARIAAAQGRATQIESWRSVVGMDAAVKVLAPELIPSVVVLTCGAPVQVLTTKDLAARLSLPWAKSFPNNPSSGFGLVWGEVRLPKEECRSWKGL